MIGCLVVNTSLFYSSTSYVMFERRSTDQVERKAPPPKPIRISSVKKPMAPPPPPFFSLSSPPLPSPPPPITEQYSDEYVYEIPCNVDKKKMKKAKKSTEDLHGKKKPKPPPLPVKLKRPAPPVPAKPVNIYQNIVNQVMSAETPVKGGSTDAGPVLLKTPAGTFLVTKLNGPLTEMSDKC